MKDQDKLKAIKELLNGGTLADNKNSVKVTLKRNSIDSAMTEIYSDKTPFPSMWAVVHVDMFQLAALNRLNNGETLNATLVVED